MSANADVELFATLNRIALALFFAPFPVGKGVEDNLSFVKSNGDMERNIIAAEIGRLVMEIDCESENVWNSKRFNPAKTFAIPLWLSLSRSGFGQVRTSLGAGFDMGWAESVIRSFKK